MASPKVLEEKQDSVSVVRPVGPLAKAGHLADVGRQMVGGTLARFGFGCREAGDVPDSPDKLQGHDGVVP